MSGLESWQKVFRARRGWVLAVDGNRVVRAWYADRVDARWLSQHGRVQLSQGCYVVTGVMPRRELLIVRDDPRGRALAIGFEDVRRIGGVFPDRLRAEVALQSGAIAGLVQPLRWD